MILSTISIERSDVFEFLASIGDDSVDLIATDPAYSGMNKHLNLGSGRIVGDRSDSENKKWFKEFDDTVENYERLLKEFKRVLKPKSHCFIMFDTYSGITLLPMVRQILDLKGIVVWDKVNIGMGHYFRRRMEFIAFCAQGNKKLTNKSTPDVWEIKRISKPTYPTQKPVELFERMIDSCVDGPDNGFIVCDPFLGSGSSALAAKNKGVGFIGCDISQDSIDLTKKRLLEGK